MASCEYCEGDIEEGDLDTIKVVRSKLLIDDDTEHYCCETCFTDAHY